MPFADELGSVEVVAHRDTWCHEFEMIASDLARAGVPEVVAIDHVGSTAVPGLAAKDVIDVQVRVEVLDDASVIERVGAAGYRLRPEDWNRTEATRSGAEHKLVFAAPEGDRRANVHVRVAASRGACDTLLFRDFLRADAAVRDAWGELKRAIVAGVPGIDLGAYGRIKQPAWVVLMVAADGWARDNGWSASSTDRGPLDRRPDR